MRQIEVLGIVAFLGLSACGGKSPVASNPPAEQAAKLTVSAQAAAGTAERPRPNSSRVGGEEANEVSGDGGTNPLVDIDGTFTRSGNTAGGPPPRVPQRDEKLVELGGELDLTEAQAEALADLQTYRRERQEEIFVQLETAAEDIEALFTEALERILTEEQVARLQALQSEPEQPERPPEQEPGGLPELLDFTPDQIAQYQVLLEEALAVRASGAEELQALEASYRSDFEALLSEAQLEAWREWIAGRDGEVRPEPVPVEEDTAVGPPEDVDQDDMAGAAPTPTDPVEIEVVEGGGRGFFLSEILNLTEEQMAQVERLEMDLEAARAEIFARVDQAQKDFEAGFTALLTDEQAARLADLQRRRDEPPEPVPPQRQRLAVLVEALMLDGEQVAALEEVLQRQDEARAAQRQEFGAPLEAVEVEYQAKLAEILTAEQLAILQQSGASRGSGGTAVEPVETSSGGTDSATETGETSSGETDSDGGVEAG